ncbi:MAG TPA: hypothetical protein VFT74_04300, partial [Isosphaeraceae bacterium]|nr:hypothetical protein [Isosphaeraceae bacterium]
MSGPKFNKYRAAMDVLQRGRDQMMEELAESLIDDSDDLMESTYAFQEMLENQGTRLHFLSLLMAQLEQSADALDELREFPPPELMEELSEEESEIEPDHEQPEPTVRKKSKPRAKNGRKLHQKQREGTP